MTLQLPPDISKLEYLDFYSSVCETEDSSKILWSREDMVNNPFLNFDYFTFENPCDSSPPPRRKHEPGTLEKFSKHGFSFFNPNIPLSLETRTKWKMGCLFHDNSHLNSKIQIWQKSKKNSKAKCKNPT